MAQAVRHRFEVLISGARWRFDRWEDIPQEIDEVICFEPVIPPAPHTRNQHDEIERWPGRLTELLRRTNATRNTCR